MTRRALTIAVAVLIMVGGAVLVWRPWSRCGAPGELCSTLRLITSTPGVADADLDYTLTRRDPKDGDSALASWTIRLDERLDPRRAGSVAGRATALAREARSGSATIRHQVTLVAGEPVGDPAVHPVRVPAGDDLQARVEEAYTLRRAGALRVDAGEVTAADPDRLLALADVAVDHGYRPTLTVADGSLRYQSGDAAPRLRDVELAVDTRRLDGVQGVIMAADRSLSVHLSRTADPARAAAIRGWLDDRDPGGRATAYQLWASGYRLITRGWIGRHAPPPPRRHGQPLPPGVEPWPDDPAAAACTATDLSVTLGVPDAAAGTRYLALLARNVSGRPCALRGTPTLTFLDAAGRPQSDVTVTPPAPGVVAARVVVPAGKRVISTIQWAAMSTANDPDVTTAVGVVAVPGADRRPIMVHDVDGPTSLDILDGATVRVGPWAQAVDGWSRP